MPKSIKTYLDLEAFEAECEQFINVLCFETIQGTLSTAVLWLPAISQLRNNFATSERLIPVHILLCLIHYMSLLLLDCTEGTTLINKVNRAKHYSVL